MSSYLFHFVQDDLWPPFDFGLGKLENFYTSSIVKSPSTSRRGVGGSSKFWVDMMSDLRVRDFLL